MTIVIYKKIAMGPDARPERSATGWPPEGIAEIETGRTRAVGARLWSAGLARRRYNDRRAVGRRGLGSSFSATSLPQILPGALSPGTDDSAKSRRA